MPDPPVVRGHDGGDPQTPGPAGTPEWLDAFVRERFGAGATLGAITFEGRLLRIEGARLPIGSITVAIARADVELGAGLPLGPLPLAARLASLRGEILVADRAIPIDLSALDPSASRWIHGTLRAGDPPAFAATIDVAPGAFHLFGVGVEARGTVVPPALARAAFDRFPLGPALAGVRAGLAPDLTLSGLVEPRADGGFRFDLTLATARSRLAIALAIDGSSALHDARLTGRLALDDVLPLLPADFAPAPGAAIELDLTASGTLADPRVRGRLFAPALALARSPALRLDDVSVGVDLDRRRLRFADLLATARGARFGGWGRIPFEHQPSPVAPLLALQIDHAEAALLADVAALFGVAVRLQRRGEPSAETLQIPSDLLLSGELSLASLRSATGTLQVSTPRSDLVLHLKLPPSGELLGSTLRGKISAADAITFGLFPTDVRPHPADAFEIDARLAGTVARPGLSGRLSSARVMLEIGPGRPSFWLDDVSVLLDVDRERLAWHRLTGRFSGGTFASSGRVAFGRAAGALNASVEWSGVRVEEIPTAPSGTSAIAAHLRGAASGSLRFERTSLAGLAARGTVTLSDPLYLFARRFAPTLARYGLPRVRSRGKGPLTAKVRLDRGDLVIDSLSGAADGIDLDAAGRLTADARVRAQLEVRLRKTFLMASPLLAIPGVLAGELVIPIYVGGTLAEPTVQTDALEILDRFFAKNRVGDAVKSVLAGLRDVVPPRKPR
jgi:hypothetical protein